MDTRATIGLVFWLVLCLGAAWTGSLITRPAIPGWYAELAKPAWTPPSWVFGPVWTALYIMMAVAAWLVWRKGGAAAAAVPLGLFLVQLALNVSWSPLFFGLHRPDLAFFVIVLLWCAILATLVAFWRVSPAAGWLLLPYLLWVTYASALNFAIWRLNA
jgi:tryptophan-rich sensory protein